MVPSGPKSGEQTCPRRAHGRGGQHPDHRVLGVGQVGGHRVAGPYSRSAEPTCHGGDLLAQFREGDLVSGVAALLHTDQGGVAVAAAAQHVFGPVEPGAGKPSCVRHRIVGEDAVRGCREPDVVVVDDRRPEPGEVGDRPLPQGCVVGVLPAFAPLQPIEIVAQWGLPDPVGGRLPDHFGHRMIHRLPA